MVVSIQVKIPTTLRVFKKKYGDPCDVVAKDKCFYFSHSEDVDDEGEKTETQSHFDFGLFGNLNGRESYSSGEDSMHFAHAYYREELKEKGCNPDIIAQQQGKDENPHKTKHVDANNKFLGKSSHRSYGCLLYTSPSPRDRTRSRMPSSA